MKRILMIGTGGTALVSKIMGQGDGERANRTFSMMIWVTVMLGAVLTALGLVFMEPMARFLGADEDTFDDCACYGRIVVAFTVSFMLQNVFQSFLITAEKPKLGLAVTVAAGVTNMFLDCWMHCSLPSSDGVLRAPPLLRVSASVSAAVCRLCTSCSPTGAACA